MRAVTDKLALLRGQLRHQPGGDPIEHVTSRLKTVESILTKVHRKGAAPTLEAIGDHVRDVAGVRVVCHLASDLYRVRDLLLAQDDVTLLTERDYIADPKPSGYRALHLVVEVPVHPHRRLERTPVEIQLRSVGTDYWARVEHEIGYMSDGELPTELAHSVRLAADVSWSLDSSLDQLHREAHALAG